LTLQAGKVYHTTVLETPHALVGAAIAARIPNPIISIPLAFASHFLLDMTPHWNPHINTELKKYGKVTNNSKFIIATDLVLAAVCVVSLALTKTDSTFPIMAGGVAAIMPDVVEGPYFFWGWKHKIIKKWLNFQKSIQVDVDLVPGIVTQIAIATAALWWIAGA